MAAIAQTAAPTGSITGTLFDSIGDPIDNNAVQAKNAESGAVFKATTSAAGKYTLADLPPGTYDISASVPGLRHLRKEGCRGASVPNRVARHSPGRHHAAQHAGRRSLEDNADMKTARSAFRSDAAHLRRQARSLRRLVASPRGRSRQARVSARGACDHKSSARKANGKDSPQAHCLPSGPLRNGPLWEFVQSKDFWSTFPTTKAPASIRFISTAAAIPPIRIRRGTGIRSAAGTATRWWWIASASTRESGSIIESHPHSDKLHIIERYHRPDLGHLEIEITVDDPGVLAKPWTQKRVADLAHEEIFEFICTENNRDVQAPGRGSSAR
jgi:hypothetical protein